MNFFQLAGNFWLEHERAPFNHCAMVLYFRLLYEAEKRSWKGPFKLSWGYLQGVLGFGKGTLARAISDLKSRGLITYHKDNGRGVFWFTHPWFQNGTENRTTDGTENGTEDRTTDGTEKQSDEATSMNTTISNADASAELMNAFKKEKKEKDQKKEEKEEKEKNQENTHTFDTPNGVSQPSAEIVPEWRLKLNEYEKQIIGTWELMVGPWEEDWLDELRNVLKVCYPAQIKQAIASTSVSQLHKLVQSGFPYLAQLLLKGVFGHRAKRKNKPKNWAEENLTGLKKFLQKSSLKDIWAEGVGEDG